MSSFHCVSKAGCQNFTVFTEKNLSFPACSIPSITATESNTTLVKHDLSFPDPKKNNPHSYPKSSFPQHHLVLASPAACSSSFPWPAVCGRAAGWVGCTHFPSPVHYTAKLAASLLLSQRQAATLLGCQRPDPLPRGIQSRSGHPQV